MLSPRGLKTVAIETIMLLFAGFLVSLAVVSGLVLLGSLAPPGETDRPRPADRPRIAQAPSFYAWRSSDMPVSDEVLLRQIEHSLRREALIAEQFIQNPSSETLHAADHSLRMH
jgi:hypothetical protein